MKNILLVDANLYIKKACYKGAFLRSERNVPSGGIYIFLKTLKSFRERFGNNCICVLDGGHSSRRKSLYPEYKQKEKKSVKELTQADMLVDSNTIFAFKHITSILHLMGIKTVQVYGEEADDVIYVLSKYFQKNPNNHIQIASGDYDYLQMVDERISVFNDNLNKNVAIHNWNNLISVPKEYYTIHKSLVGDSSDNITGVKRIGEKTSEKILNQLSPNPQGDFQTSLSNLYSWCEDGSSDAKRRIKEAIPVIKRNYLLMDLRAIEEDTAEKIISHYLSLEDPVSDYKKFSEKMLEIDIKTFGDLF